MQEGDLVILRGPKEDFLEDEFKYGFVEEMNRFVGDVVAVKNLRYNEDGEPDCFDVDDDKFRTPWTWDAKFVEPCEKSGFTDDVEESEFNAVLD